MAAKDEWQRTKVFRVEFGEKSAHQFSVEEVEWQVQRESNNYNICDWIVKRSKSAENGCELRRVS